MFEGSFVREGERDRRGRDERKISKHCPGSGYLTYQGEKKNSKGGGGAEKKDMLREGIELEICNEEPGEPRRETEREREREQRGGGGGGGESERKNLCERETGRKRVDY